MNHVITSYYNDEIWQVSSNRKRQAWIMQLIYELCNGADTVLDLGCGDGVHLPVFAGCTKVQIGVDRSIVALSQARERIPKAWLELIGDDERLPFAENTVDIVWCCDTLEHVVDTQTVLSEVRRVLKPAGKFIAITPNHSLFKRLWLAVRGWNRHFDPFSPHLRFYTKSSLSEALDGMGFEVASVTRHKDYLVAIARRG